MNKLNEAAEKIRAKIEEFQDFEGKIRWNDLATIEEYTKEKLVEYARSVINIESNPLIELPLSDYIKLESAWDKKHKEMFARIDQDLLSLTDK